MTFDPEEFKRWTPQAQAKALDAVRQIEQSEWRPFYCPKGARSHCDGLPHDEWQWNHARSDQHPPRVANWFVWLLRGGRGSGKTRTGAEYVNRKTKHVPRIAIVGRTGPDIRETLIEGESGILACAKPGERPDWEPSKRKLTWPNGCVGQCFTAEEPDTLRGPNNYFAWVDEPAHMPLIEDVWDQLLYTMRKEYRGSKPQIVCTTTPTPIKWMKELVADPDTVDVRVHSDANIHNLSDVYRKKVIDPKRGTRKGRQELGGEILEDVEGALWSIDLLDPYRVDTLPEFDRVIVGLDPAGTARRRSDETSIVTVGAVEDHLYALDDVSGRLSPDAWGRRVLAQVDKWDADGVAAEQTYGGDMVVKVLKSVAKDLDVPVPRIFKPSTYRGKVLRAEPIVAVYEQERAHHYGVLQDLEDQMTTWIPTSTKSPDRIDGLVHAATEALKGHALSQMATPSQDARPVLSVVRSA